MPARKPAHAILRDAVVGLRGGDDAPRLAFRIVRNLAMEQAAIDAWLFQTVPDDVAVSRSDASVDMSDLDAADEYQL